MARTYYVRPNNDDVDTYFRYFFRCNSTLANEGTLYNVDCMPALDLSDKSSFITRREDATMQCPKTMQNSSFFVGVSQNSFIHGVQEQSVFFNLILTDRTMQVNFNLKLSVYLLGLDI